MLLTVLLEDDLQDLLEAHEYGSELVNGAGCERVDCDSAVRQLRGADELVVSAAQEDTRS